MLELRRPWIHPCPRGLSGVLTGGAPHGRGICICPTQWTNVVHRDGRRSRPWHADVAQLVAHHLAKVRVAGSNPVIRSRMQWHQPQRWSGRVVRQRPAKPCTRVRFPSPPPKFVPARLAQRESASLTRKRSLVQSQYRAPARSQARVSRAFFVSGSPSQIAQSKHPSPAPRRFRGTIAVAVLIPNRLLPL